MEGSRPDDIVTPPITTPTGAWRAAAATSAPPAQLYRAIAAITLVYLVAMAIVFRAPILSGFDLGFGDRADGIIEISILEHWRNVFSGAARWDTTGYFHPYAGTLGYNDGYFLYGLVYSLWRLIADPFHADTLNILTFKTIGFMAAYRLVAHALGYRRPAGLLVALLWTISANMSVQAVHAQLQSVALLPVAMLLAIGATQAERAGRSRAARVRAVALAALMAAWLMTSYYMAWFTLFSAGLFVACWAGLTGTWRPRVLLPLLRRHGATLAWGGMAFGLLIVPFLIVYLPKARETGGQAYQVVLGYLVTPLVDMINVGPDNYLWGWIFRGIAALIRALVPSGAILPERVIGAEHISGVPPILFVLIVTAAWRLIVRRRTGRPEPVAPHFVPPASVPPTSVQPASVQPARIPVELRAFALAMIVAWLFTLQFLRASPWGLVFEFVPGARGMRVVGRYQLWLTLPLMLLAVAAWHDHATRLARRAPWLAGAIALVLVAENLGAFQAAQLSRSVQRAAVSAIPAPPPGCAAFYVVATRRGEPVYVDAAMNALYPHNVDAMLLAELWRVPTINGFSTFNPPDWNVADPLAPDYDARVADYARRHTLRGLCRLDMRQPRPWTKTG